MRRYICAIFLGLSIFVSSALAVHAQSHDEKLLVKDVTLLNPTIRHGDEIVLLASLSNVSQTNIMYQDWQADEVEIISPEGKNVTDLCDRCRAAKIQSLARPNPILQSNRTHVIAPGQTRNARFYWKPAAELVMHGQYKARVCIIWIGSYGNLDNSKNRHCSEFIAFNVYD